MAHSLKIPFEGLHNTRDFGGFPIGNRKIKYHKLLRSGQLARGTRNDITRLYREFDVKTVIDLRNLDETARMPDNMPEGTDIIALPVLDRELPGISHGAGNSIPELTEYLKHNGSTPRSLMISMYDTFIRSPYACSQYKRFFDIVCEDRPGAVLWHCTAGKDRAGMAAAFMLLALGASETDVIEDYLSTQDNYASDIDTAISRCRDETHDDACIKTLYCMISVFPEYIQAALSAMRDTAGSIDDYLENNLGLTAEKRSLLKKIYLE